MHDVEKWEAKSPGVEICGKCIVFALILPGFSTVCGNNVENFVLFFDVEKMFIVQEHVHVRE